MTEVERIRAVYARRQEQIPPGFYSRTRRSVLFAVQRRWRTAIQLIGPGLAVETARVLEVGCGEGGWLPDWIGAGVAEERLAGIELCPTPAEIARRRFPRADIRIGDASHLPWPDRCFDIVLASTVFTSILDPAMKQDIAREMLRVLRRDGFALWYDYQYDNPANPDVRGVTLREVRRLFPDCRIRARRVTLAPPIARRVVPVSWTLAEVLETAAPFLRTHILAVISPGPR